ncbi:hypothetical protein Tco_0644325 [Tanacetum coccineum]
MLPRRQQVATARAAQADQEIDEEDRMARLKEEVRRVRESLGEQRVVLDGMSRDFSRYRTRDAPDGGPREPRPQQPYALTTSPILDLSSHDAYGCAGSDTCPPMLDKSDFESWQQRIRLYYLGKYNGENILKSIDEGPFKMGKFRETLAEGALHLGLEQDRVFVDLTPEEKERFKAIIYAMNILLQGLPKYIYTLINHYTDAKDIWDNEKMLLEGSELTKDERESQLYDEIEHFRQNKG